MTIASPIAGVRHWALLRATCPTSAPHGPRPGRLPGSSHSIGMRVAEEAVVRRGHEVDRAQVAQRLPDLVVGRLEMGRHVHPPDDRTRDRTCVRRVLAGPRAVLPRAWCARGTAFAGG